MSQNPKGNGKHLVILVHGINTRAKWLYLIREVLREEGFLVEFAGYGVISIPQFLLPIGYFRRKAVRRVFKRIETAIQVNKPERTSIIAHSFGSYVVSNILLNSNQKFHRIIFCGSVVSIDHPFGDLIDKFASPIVNEVASNDIWPAMAESVTWGYGSIGSYGFVGAPLIERFHPKLGHSGYFTEKFCKTYWVPFLKRGEIVENSTYVPPNVISKIVSFLKFKYWILCYILVFFLNFTGLAMGLTNSRGQEIIIESNKSDRDVVLSKCKEWIESNSEKLNLFSHIEFFNGGKKFESKPIYDQYGEYISDKLEFVGIECKAIYSTGPLIPIKKLYDFIHRTSGAEIYCSNETKTTLPDQICIGRYTLS